MIVIPAIDIIEGEIVRLKKGEYSEKTKYPKDPVEMAKEIEVAGLHRLHLVDLDGAKIGRPMNLRVLEKISSQTALEVEWGGGVRSWEDLEAVFSSGAKYIILGSVVLEERGIIQNWLSMYGSRLILSADSKGGKIRTHGWEKDSGEEIVPYVRKNFEEGFSSIIATEIERDGILEGPSYELYESLMEISPTLKVIASGGVSSTEDLWRLRDIGLYGAIVGRALYEGKISLIEMKESQ